MQVFSVSISGRKFDIKRNKDGSFIMPDELKQWENRGTGLKPAYEPILICMKPLEGTYVENAMKWGVAGLNIDESRIGTDEVITNHSRGTESAKSKGKYGDSKAQKTHQTKGQKEGRWPANVLLSHHPDCELVGRKTVKSSMLLKKHNLNETKSVAMSGKSYKRNPRRDYAPDGKEIVEDWNCHPDCPIRLLDEQSGQLKSGDLTGQPRVENKIYSSAGSTLGKPLYYKGDSGGASRFFYCAKASKAERDAGCEELEGYFQGKSEGGQRTFNDKCGNCGKKFIGEEHCICDNPKTEKRLIKGNYHPTVKPLKLLEYLCKLTKTPTGGVVLDPFIGSGTTAVACIKTGRDYIGIEMEEEYVKIAEARIKHENNRYPLFKVLR